MENARKNLRLVSEVILIILTISLVRSILEVLLSKGSMDGIPAELVSFAKIGFCVAAVVLSIPQIYIGVKGIKVANNPDSSKAHIVWGVIFTIFSVFSVISAVSGLTKGGNTFGDILALVSAVAQFALYFIYVKCAKQVAAKA